MKNPHPDSIRRLVAMAVMLFFFITTLSAQNKKLDSLTTALSQHPGEDTTRVNILVQICYFEYNSNPEKARQTIADIQRISEKLNYQKGIGSGYRYKALSYWVKGDYDSAATFAHKMLKVYEDNPVGEGLAQANTLLGLVHEEMANFDQAKAYHFKSLEYNLAAKKKYNVGYNYNSIGSLYHTFSKYDTAIYYYRKSLAIRLEIGDEDGQSQSFNNLALMHKIRNEYDTAIAYFNMALPIARRFNNRTRISTVSRGLGEMYIITKQYAKAEPHLREALSLAQSMESKKGLREIYHQLMLLEDKRNNPRRALEYSILENQYQDSLFTQEKTRQVTELETRYETEKKEQAIRLLEKENELNQLWRKIMIAAIVAGSFIFVAIYFLQRSRNRKSKQLLDIQQTLTEKLREVDGVKSKFFANISHEFRTPLTLILAPLDEKLKATAIAPAEREELSLMRRSARRLLDLVNQLLDLSRLDAGKMKIQVKSGDVMQFLRVIAASFDSLAQHKKVEFIKNIQSPTTQTWFDDDKLEKIITNVLSNAFKFTPAHGAVTLNVSAEEQKLKITVADTGIGIPDDEQEEIFSPFYQAKKYSEGNTEGTGLGLPLVRELVRLYNGQVTLVSKENEGTTVTIFLPVAETEFVPEQRIDEPLKEIIRESKATQVIDADDDFISETPFQDSILIVEDNLNLRHFMITTLQQEFRVLAASNGDEGYQAAVSNIPSLILSDLMMPNVDGIAMTRRLKNDERTSHIPVILLTAKNEPESRIEGLNTGADDYLTKPFSTDELKARIMNLIRQRKMLAEKFKERIVVLTSETSASSMEDRFLHKARKLVEDNLDDSAFSVEKMAEEIGLSRTQLLRKLKALTGISPNEFIKDLRLQKAAELIRQKADTVTQIGYRVGFNDQSYFTKCFKRKFGVAPSEFK